jgi:L-threonylcarbamoyladenylate synthase
VTSAAEWIDVRDFMVLEPSLDPAVRRLRAGGLLAYPTETLYGFGCLLQPEPLARLSAAKSRGTEKQMLVLVPSAEAVRDLSWNDEARSLAAVFWPGAVTLILGDPAGRFPEGVRSPGGGVGVRVSPHPVVKALMGRLGEPLVSTSANLPGDPAMARSGDEAVEIAEALGIGDDLTVLDAGVLPESEASTVIDCRGPGAAIIREGRVPLGRVRCVLPGVEVRR